MGRGYAEAADLTHGHTAYNDVTGQASGGMGIAPIKSAKLETSLPGRGLASSFRSDEDVDLLEGRHVDQPLIGNAQLRNDDER